MSEELKAAFLQALAEDEHFNRRVATLIGQQCSVCVTDEWMGGPTKKLHINIGDTELYDGWQIPG